MKLKKDLDILLMKNYKKICIMKFHLINLIIFLKKLIEKNNINVVNNLK